MSHPDVETLAELVDGALPADEAVALRGHLAGCAACTADTASLRGALDRVAGLLAGLPAPSLPDDVAARLDAALAAAPPLTGTPPALAPGAPEVEAEVEPVGGGENVAAPGPTSGTVTTLPTVRRGRPRGAWLGAAAASVVVIAGAGVFAAGQQGGSDQAATGGATMAAPSGATVVASGTDYDPALLDARVPGLLGAGSSAYRSLEDDGGQDGGGQDTGTGGAGPAGAPEAGAPGAGAPAAVGPETDAGDLDAGAVPAALARLEGDTALQACLSELSGMPSTEPLALDYASYQGSPALVVVLAGLSQDRVDVFVVGPGCAPRQADLLVYRSVPR